MRGDPMTSLATPRAPAAPLGAALYESHYLTAADPAGGRALWLRFTALKRAGEPAHLTTWLTFFDASAEAPRALRVTAVEPLAQPGAGWARSSLGEIGPSGTRGEMSDGVGPAGSGPRASWELRWAPRAGEVAYLPARWLYDRPVPRSNGAALVPAGTASGALVLDGESIDVDGWEAMVGHNWGSEHAHQWCWMHAGRLGEDGRGWLDLALVRIRIGPLVTPWIASGALDLDGRRYAPAPVAGRDLRARRGADERPRVTVGGRHGDRGAERPAQGHGHLGLRQPARPRPCRRQLLGGRRTDRGGDRGWHPIAGGDRQRRGGARRRAVKRRAPVWS
jgi:hypothetical protein